MWFDREKSGQHSSQTLKCDSPGRLNVLYFCDTKVKIEVPYYFLGSQWKPTPLSAMFRKPKKSEKEENVIDLFDGDASQA